MAQRARMRTWADGVDEVGGLGRAGADPAEDFPALELGVGAFAGSALAGVGGSFHSFVAITRRALTSRRARLEKAHCPADE